MREQSTKALRTAADKLHELADYMDEARNSAAKNPEEKKP